jgi:hypothetical protein
MTQNPGICIRPRMQRLAPKCSAPPETYIHIPNFP